jgi:subtilisin-like proprotein convertase family protein
MNRRRTSTWLVLSLGLFLSGLVIWHFYSNATRKTAPQLAAERAERIAKAERAARFTLTPIASVHSASTAPIITSLEKTNVGSVESARTEREKRLKYRLSNTSQSLSNLMRSDKAILLENALIDSSLPLKFSIPDSLKSEGDPGTYIVQSRGVIDADFRGRLQHAGAKIISYIPNNAYLVRVSAGGAQDLADQTGTQAVVPFEPYYKLDLSLLKSVVEKKPTTPSLNLLVFNDARDATIGALNQMGVDVVSQTRGPFESMIVQVANARDVAGIARLPGVQRVETRTERRPANDLSRARIKVANDPLIDTNYLGLTGQGVIVDMNDFGFVDALHPDLQGRVFSLFPLAFLQDPNGHATHVGATIIGDGSKSMTVTNAPGSPTAAGGSYGTNQFRGMAPKAVLYSMPLGFNDIDLQQFAARTNALISNNSWTYGNPDYDIFAASYDAAARDSLPETTGSQPVLYVFAAGNGGTLDLKDGPGGVGDDNGLGGVPGTVLSPATGKNGLTIGAIEQKRNMTNIVQKVSGGATNNFQPWAGSTDSSNQVASFSARGNVGIGIEGDFGRFKPDVVAPGTFVVSARSGQWDTNAYYNPTNYNSQTFSRVTVGTNTSAFLLFPPVFVPDNAVQLTISVAGANPAVDLPIYVTENDIPDPNNDTPLGINQVSLPPDAPLTKGTIYFYGVNNPTNVPVQFDLTVTLVTTNENGNYFQVLSNLNDALGPYYRYESGTSMSAADVSGMLALMQEFFQTKGITNSPALMKALVINGARSVNTIYDFNVHNSITYQGWGLVNLSNSLPFTNITAAPAINPSVGAQASMLMWDQNPTNALATGDSHTYKIKVDPFAVQQPLRVTLVWTDPAGNPAAGLKLVNDLNLIVTNLDDPANPLVYFGNDIEANSDFSSSWDTNTAQNVDIVNNVENVYLLPTIGTNYSITVVGRAVNANAVTAHTNNIVQDYALVISSGDGQNQKGLTLMDAGAVISPNFTNITIMTNQFGTSNQKIFGQILNPQRVGANSPLIGTDQVPFLPASGVITLGETNQWHFYIVTNATTFTNAVFATSLPIDLAAHRMGVTNTLNPGEIARAQADIDLYVTTDPGLLTLDPNAVDAARKSLNRGGYEQIIFTNAVPGATYYAGVKSEDQQAAQYEFTVLFSQDPFGDDNNNHFGVPTPQNIPDGSPALPGRAEVHAYVATEANVKVRRVIVTNLITHENFGDLLGAIDHQGEKSTVLHNNQPLNNYPGFDVYDDTGSTPGGLLSEGPGSLLDFIGDTAQGQWTLTEIDSALTHTGRIDEVTIHIDPHIQDDLPPGATTGLVLDNCVVIRPNASEFDFVEVPFTGLSVQLCLSNSQPMQLLIRNGALPTATTFDYSTTIPAGGGCFTVSVSDIPPLQPGLLYFRIVNPNGSIEPVCYKAFLTVNSTAVQPVIYGAGATPTIKDDAITYSSINVSNTQRIASAAVGVVLNHPRVSDLVLTLLSPTGKRYTLFDERGGQNATNIGHINITTNFFGTTTAGDANASTNILSPVTTSGTLLINYDFFQVPDRMDVYYDGVNIFSTTQFNPPSGLISGAGTFTIPYGPGVGNSISIVMNQGGNPNTGTAWIYTPSVVNLDYTYLTFSEDPNLTQLPVKFATPLDLGGNGVNFVLSDFELSTNGEYFAPTNIFDPLGGWNMFTNDVVIGTNVFNMTNNEVSVVTDPNTAPQIFGTNTLVNSNFLALANGAIMHTIQTIPGRRYTVSYQYRGPGISGWWRGEGDANDSSDPESKGNNGETIGRFEYPAGAVGQAFQFEDAGQQFRFAGTNTYVQVRQSDSLDVVHRGGGLTIEGWINPTNVSFQQPLVEWIAPVPTNWIPKTSNEVTNLVFPYDTNMTIVAGPFLNRATLHYYYLLQTTNWTRSEIWAKQLGGHLATVDNANEEFWIYDSFSQYGGTNRWLWIGLTNRSPNILTWASGQTNVFYTNWVSGQPFNCSPGGSNAIYTAVINPTNAQAGLWTLATDAGITCSPTTNGIHIYGVVEVNEIQTNGVQLWVSVTNSSITSNGCLYADIVDVSNFSHVIYSPPGLIQSNVFQHVALTYSTNSGIANLYYNGTNVASTNLGSFVPKTGGDVLLGKDMSLRTNNYYAGKQDEISIYERFLSPAEVAAIYRVTAYATNYPVATNDIATNRVFGKFDPRITPSLGLAEAQVSLNGVTNVILGRNKNWQTHSFTFTAVDTNVTMQFVGIEPGILLDSFNVAIAPPGNLYVLPEELMTDLVGEFATGKWTLEIRDARGGPTDTNLLGRVVSWQLQFIFQNQPLTIPLTPYLVESNVVPAGKIAYFSVDVPSWAGFATNILVSADNPVSVWFNQTTLPSGTPADTQIIGPSTAPPVKTYVLATNGTPKLLPGQRYFLGVSNAGPAAATVALRVDYNIVTLSNSVPVTAFLNTNDTAQYFAFDVASSNALEATFQLLQVSNNVDLVVSKGLPLPTLTNTDYGSFNTGNADENIYVLTNSFPTILSTGRWYLGVFKRNVSKAQFSVLAKELDPPDPTIINLANNVPFNFTAGPGAALTNFFRFTVSNSPASLRFELYNMTGNGDLTVQTNTPPLSPAFFASSQQPGVGMELIFIHTNSSLPSLNQSWYLGVPNHETNLIRYTIVASIDTNSYFPAFPTSEGAGGGAAGGRFGDVYHVVNLNDSGPGSLRQGVLSAITNRTIVFDVSGTINLLSPLIISNSNLTIAGQTAPGSGITVSGELTSVENVRDVVVRYLHFRSGDVNSTNRSDTFRFNFATNVIADHVTATLSGDSALSAYWSTNVTVQWSMIAEDWSATNACSTNSPPNGFGSILRFGDGSLTFHHNLYADNYSANPRLGDNLKLDFVDNVIYNWGALPGFSLNDLPDNPGGFTNYLSYIANYLIAGPDTATNMLRTAFLSRTTNTFIWQTNNLIDSNTNHILDGANTGWLMFTNDFVPAFYTPTNIVFPDLALSVDEAFIAYEKVLDFAGASLDKRDGLDRTVVTGVRAQTGTAAFSPLAGIVAWWKGEGNTVDSVNGSNGVATNITYAAGEVGQALQFDGSSSLVTAPASQSLAVSNLTFEGWIFPTSAQYEPIIDYGGPGQFSPVHFWVNGAALNNNLPGVLYANIRNTPLSLSSAAVVPQNAWSHVAFTLDVNTGAAVIYFNGAQVAATSLPLPIDLASTLVPVNIGYRDASSMDVYRGSHFAGGLDEISIYNRALSACEIAAIYNAGAAGKRVLLSANSNVTNTVPYLDSDQDGAPEFWETTLGENPTNGTASFIDRDGDGYTDLEEYLNWLGAPHALTITNTPVDVDLYRIAGNTGNLTFFVTNAMNGTVYLTNRYFITNGTVVLSNTVAVFSPTNNPTNYFGYASFDFYVTNTDTTASFGPTKVSVFVSAVPILYGGINTNPPVFVTTNPPAVTNIEQTPIIVTNTATTVNTNLTLSYSVTLTIDTNATTANGWPLTYLTTVPAPTINTNGVITWTPSEAQGPGVYIITTVVSDNGAPSLSATNSFSVTVLESNVPPVLPFQPNRTNSALVTMIVTNTATDSDIPPNPLTYTLIVVPTVTNAFISTNGIITWTPTPAQAGATYRFTTIVTDTNQFAISQQSLSATNSFNVTVPGIAPPLAFTQPAQAVTGASARLNGMVTPGGLPTTAWFEWGTTTNYGNTTPLTGVGNSFNVVYHNSTISGLATNVAYHFRIVASNALTVVYGFDQILDEANVVVWGANYVGQAAPPPGLSNIVAIAGAYDHSLALRNNETVVAWGDNAFGQSTVPAGINNNVLAVAGGQYYSMALRNGGTVNSWGANILAQTNVPPGLNNVVMIAGGTFSSLALRNNGTVVAWGANFFGLTNVPAGLSNVVSIAGGQYHNLAIRNDGTVVAWGDNSANQTTVPPNATNVVAIAAGSYHSLALRSDGSVVAWGDNSAGQSSVPSAALNNVVAVAAGGFHSLALKSDGTIVAWGDNSAGQISVPVGLSNVVAIASGYFHSLALTPQLSVGNNIILDLFGGVAQTNSILPGSVTYYQVSVPTNADFATNSLLFTINGPLNVWFSTNFLPTIGRTNDALLLAAATNGVSILDTNNVFPNIVPGDVYYLGVQNTNAASVAYGIEVDFHFTTAPQTTNEYPISSIVYTNIGGTNGFLLTWFAPSNDLFQVQWASNLPPTWNTFPVIVGYDTNVFSNPTNTQFDFFDDGSLSGGLSSPRFYRVILLSSSTPTNPPPTFVTLTNMISYSASNSGGTSNIDFYRYVVTNNPATRAQFEVDNPSGDVTLIIRKGSVPSLGTSDYISTNSFTNSEVIIVVSNSTPVTLTNGDWYLGVVNVSGGSVNYSVKASEWPATGQPINVTNISYNGSSFCLTWDSLPGAYYHIEGINTLGATNWTVASPTILATNYSTTYCVSPVTNNFYRVVEGIVLSTNQASSIPVVDLTNGIGYSASNAGGANTTDYYHYVVTNNPAARAQLEVMNPSGNVTLVARKGLPLPSLATNDYISQNPLTNSELIIIFTNSSPVALTPGDWYLAVVNLSGGSVSYTVKATEWPVTGQPINVTNVTYNGSSFCLYWQSLPGAYYYIEGINTLGATNWTVASPTITATGYSANYCVSPVTNNFYRVVEGLVLSAAAVPPPVVSVTYTNGHFLLQWNGPTTATYQAQWASNLPPAWNSFSNIIGSGTGQFSFLDDGSQTPGGLGVTRYYRVMVVP